MEGVKRKYFVAANWKSNGTTAFTKDIVNNLFNTFTFDQSKLGNIVMLKEFRLAYTTRTFAYVFSKSNGKG